MGVKQYEHTRYKPKNGSYFVCLLAGGELHDATMLRRRLADHGVNLAHHLTTDNVRTWQRAIPADVDVVVVLKDAVSHRHQGLIVQTAKAQGVPFVRTQRRWTVMAAALRVHGLFESPPVPVAAQPSTPPQGMQRVERIDGLPELPPAPTPAEPDAEELALRAWLSQMLTRAQLLMPAGRGVTIVLTAAELSMQWQ